MTTEQNNKAELRKWGRNLIQLSSVGLFMSLAFSTLWVAILIWSAEDSQWKIASILGTVTSIALGAVFVGVRRRLYAFMVILASEFSASDHRDGSSNQRQSL